MARPNSMVYGVGVSNTNARINGVMRQDYRMWSAILERCYSPKSHIRKPTYKNSTVCNEWLDFSEFKKWFDQNYVAGFQIDADLFRDGSRVYSPSTCCMIPAKINMALQKMHSHNTSGYAGVQYSKNKKKWVALIKINGLVKRLGTFDNAIDASNAYNDAHCNRLCDMAEAHKHEISDRVYNRLVSKQIAA
jgi:hypothetical protein